MADSGMLSFVELMKQQPSYGPLLDKPGITYKLMVLYNGTYWSLAIQGDQPGLPYVTIEVISDDGTTAVRLVDYKEDELSPLKPINIGTYGPGKKLIELCQVADETFKEVYTSKDTSKKDKRQEFTSCLVAKLGFKGKLTTTTTTYYTIEVQFGNGYQECYLGTQFNDMRFPANIPDGNISAYWNCDPNAIMSSIINAVTEQSSIPTYMVLGASISSNPQTYHVNLSGPEKNFYFMNHPQQFAGYAIATEATEAGNDYMTYLMPQRSGAIVAVAQMEIPHIFRLTPRTEVLFAFPSTP